VPSEIRVPGPRLRRSRQHIPGPSCLNRSSPSPGLGMSAGVEVLADVRGQQAGVEIFEPLGQRSPTTWKGLDEQISLAVRMPATAGTEFHIVLIYIAY